MRDRDETDLWKGRGPCTRTRPEVIVCPSRRFLLAADNPNTETPTRAKKVIKKKKSPNHKETPRTPDDVITKTELEMVGVLVFGDNDSAQLALSSTTEGALEHDETILSPRPIPALSAGTHVRSVAFGTCHAAWLMADGGVFTVGDNGNGQCGVSAPAVLKTPQRLESLAAKYQAVQVSCGGAFTAVVTACGQLATFGANDHGQCGHGPEALLDVRKPKLVKSSVGDISMVACGEAHTLVLDLSAAVHSCGNGRFGALGHGDMESVSSPALIRARARRGTYLSGSRGRAPFGCPNLWRCCAWLGLGSQRCARPPTGVARRPAGGDRAATATYATSWRDDDCRGWRAHAFAGEP